MDSDRPTVVAFAADTEMDPSPAASRMLQLTVLGHPIQVRSDVPDADLEAIQRLIREQAGRLTEKAPHAPSAQIPLLVALNLAEALHEAQKQIAGLVRDAEQQANPRPNGLPGDP